MEAKCQGKVSMVVPCYNKECYISAMLDSVLAQQWDNIELILVNDGSTDRTRDVIISYLIKFKARGYEIKLIDQKNGGCCKAVHTGLLNMTGDYYCLVDADDEIEPGYVLTMAKWLDEHADYEWAACSCRGINKIDEKYEDVWIPRPPYHQDCEDLLVHYIFRNVITTVWIYMMRTSYVRKCKMIENFCTERSRTYEPLIIVPTAYFGGKMKYFNEPLYKYNMYASDLFGFDSIEKVKAYYDDYMRMYEWSISRLSIPDSEKKRYLDMTKLSYKLELFKQIPKIMRAQSRNLAVDTVALLNQIGKCDVKICAKDFDDWGYDEIFRAIEHRYMISEKKYKRIIGYGALGKNALRILPRLVGSQYCPTLLWDKAGDGNRIKQPDFESLTSDDLLLVFPSKETVVCELKKELKDSPATVYFKAHIDLYIIAEAKYPQLSEFEV